MGKWTIAGELRKFGQWRASVNCCGGLISRMIPRRIVLILIAIVLASSVTTASRLLNPRFPSRAIAFCGEVEACDLFDQTLLIKEDGGNVETIPFSRWTDLFQILTDSRGRQRRQAIEPTKVATGDRLCIRFDPREATAELIEVLPAKPKSKRKRLIRTSTKMDHPVCNPWIHTCLP
jgi:hypothetical protein